MAEGKKTYYQVSFTGGQALAAVIAVILALGVAFFFGAKAGFERLSDTETAPGPRDVHAVPAPPVAAESPATTAPTPAATLSPAPATSATAAVSTEEAPVFEDREAAPPEARGSATIGPAPSTGPSRTEIAGAPAAAAPKKSAPASPAPGGASSAAEKTPAEAGAASSRSGYYVQVLSTSSKAEAARWKEKLAAKSYHTAAVTTVESKKGKLYRVRTGPYPDLAQAKKAAAKISADFKQKAWVASE
jgi:septal ring-binding cell division protein DamX